MQSAKKRQHVGTSQEKGRNHLKRHAGAFRFEIKHPVEPTCLLGRRVTVKWEDANGWYNGTVTAYLNDTCKHQIDYDDGDQEQIRIGLEIPVKVELEAGEDLPLPPPVLLEQLVKLLLEEACQADEAAAAQPPYRRRELQREGEQKRKQVERLLELADVLTLGEQAQGQQQVQWQSQQLPQHQQPHMCEHIQQGLCLQQRQQLLLQPKSICMQQRKHEPAQPSKQGQPQHLRQRRGHRCEQSSASDQATTDLPGQQQVIAGLHLQLPRQMQQQPKSAQASYSAKKAGKQQQQQIEGSLQQQQARRGSHQQQQQQQPIEQPHELQLPLQGEGQQAQQQQEQQQQAHTGHEQQHKEHVQQQQQHQAPTRRRQQEVQQLHRSREVQQLLQDQQQLQLWEHCQQQQQQPTHKQLAQQKEEKQQHKQKRPPRELQRLLGDTGTTALTGRRRTQQEQQQQNQPSGKHLHQLQPQQREQQQPGEHQDQVQQQQLCLQQQQQPAGVPPISSPKQLCSSTVKTFHRHSRPRRLAAQPTEQPSPCLQQSLTALKAGSPAHFKCAAAAVKVFAGVLASSTAAVSPVTAATAAGGADADSGTSAVATAGHDASITGQQAPLLTPAQQAAAEAATEAAAAPTAERVSVPGEAPVNGDSAEQIPATTVGAAAASEAPAVVLNDMVAAAAVGRKLLGNGQVNAANIPGLGFTQVEWVSQPIGPKMSLAEAQRVMDLKQQEQQHQQRGTVLDLLQLDQELEGAYAAHQQLKQEHTLFKEMDVSLRVCPNALVGRQLRVYWELDDAWFAGSVESFDAATGKHKVVYEDNDCEEVWMGLQRVRLLISAGEQLVPPDALTLQQLAHTYKAQARQLEQQQDDSSDVESEDLELPGRLNSKAEVLLGAAYVKCSRPPPHTYLVKRNPTAGAGGSGGAGSGSSRGRWRKSASSSRTAAAAPAGSACAEQADVQPSLSTPGTTPETQAEATAAEGGLIPGAVVPADATTPTLAHDAEQGQQPQHQQHAPAQISVGGKRRAPEQEQEQQQHDNRNSISALDQHTRPPPGRRALQVLQQASTGNIDACKQSDKLSQLQEKPRQQQQKCLQQQQQQATLQQHQEPDAAADTTPAEEGASAAVDRPPPDVGCGLVNTSAAACTSSNNRSSAVVFSVQPGEVVWVTSKSNPPWPALVITSEEATDFSIPAGLTRHAQVCVQYFGDYARSRVSPMALLPPSVALAQRVWLPTVLTGSKRKSMVRMVDVYLIALKEFITFCKTGELPDSEMVPEHNDERWLLDDQAAEHGDALFAPSHSPGAAAAAPGQACQRKQQHQQPADMGVKDLMAWAASLVADAQAGTGARSTAAAGGAGVRKKLPLQLAPNLVLLSLGRVEFVHPGFHNDKFIFPVGFSIRRRARTPCSGGKDVWHLAEIVEAPDGTGPLFRVTAEGSKPITGNTPTGAWQELYKSPAAGAVGSKASAAATAARAASVCGPRLFGLQHPLVAALIQALPNAAACDRFLAWKGEPPPSQPLTPELQLARRAISARLQVLPPGITPQPITRRMVSACDACGEELETEDNCLVECDRCRVVVHMRCYGLAHHPNGGSWLCDVCRLPGLIQPPACVLCPRVGGAMKVTAEGGWCHLMCATWVPGCCVADSTKMEPIVGAQRVSKERLRLVCSVCHQPYGACIQCAGSSKCYSAFHPMCARDVGYPMAAVYDEDDESALDQEEEQHQEHGQHDQPQVTTTAAAADGILHPAQEQQQQQVGIEDAPSRKGKAKQKSKARKPAKVQQKEGTAAGDNTLLLCFCPRHKQVASGMSRSLIFQSATSMQPQPAAGATAAQSSAAIRASNGQLLQQSSVTSTYSGDGMTDRIAGAAAATVAGKQQQEAKLPAGLADGQLSAAAAGASTGSPVGGPGAAVSAAAVVGGSSSGRPWAQGVMLYGESVTAGAGTCARSRPADTAVRRGLRAPDALAAALRKRLYVQATPYLVTGCTRAGQLLPPPVNRARYSGPEFEQLQQQPLQGQQGSSSGPGGSQAACGAPTALAPLSELRPSAAAGGSVGAPGVVMPFLSLADRYRQMQATVSSRICSGKSAIHGLGVFAKVPHKAGDLIVEYIGHLVRPLVADMLEARTYNQLVGAGTYIFSLNDSQCVDATRAGNMAHLINHSCAPCCHSRTITVRNPSSGKVEDHVVIVASRDIMVGEELTYDYRFTGEEKLHCNCGAASCRGWVNKPACKDSPRRPSDNSLWVPRRELECVKDAAAAALREAMPSKKKLQL